MTDRELFFLGCKLFGLYCLVLGFPYIIAIIPLFFPQPEVPEGYRQILRISKVVSFLIPIIYISGGFYLIKDSNFLYELAYRGKINHASDFSGKILVFIKMLGLFLVVDFFPDVLKQISEFLISINTPKVFDLFSQSNFTISHGISSIGSMIFGIYLFISGKYFERMFISKDIGES